MKYRRGPDTLIKTFLKGGLSLKLKNGIEILATLNVNK